MSVSTRSQLEALLGSTFAPEHVAAAIEHYELMTQEFHVRSWEPCLVKAGKFVEAVLKALWRYVGETVPPAKEFKVGFIIRELEKKPGAIAPTTIRVTIPRACQFVYEIASNRGARHDPDELNPNEMDAAAVVADCSWILAEMLRFATRGKPSQAHEWVSRLTKRKLPIYEEVDGRAYFHIKDLKPREIALLNLWKVFPNRMATSDLIAAATRQGATANAARLGLRRLRNVVDDDGNGNLRMLSPGITEAEALLLGDGRRRT